MSNITLRQLTIFSQVVEQGSFNRCAKFLDVSNVAITNHIKKLEEGIGHKLFARTPGGVAVLTEEGKRDYQRILSVLAAFSELTEGANQAPIHRKLSITLEPFIFHCMRKEVQQFEKKHPELNFQLELEEVSFLEIEKQLKTNKLDIAYFYAAEDYFSPESEFVCHVPLAIYVSKGHPLANKKLVKEEELRKFEVLKTSKNNYLNNLFSRAMEEVGLTGLSIALETDNISIFGSSLEGNSVFTCMSEWVEETEYGKSIQRLNFEYPLPKLQLRQIIRPPLNHDPLIQEATKLFTSSFR